MLMRMATTKYFHGSNSRQGHDHYGATIDHLLKHLTDHTGGPHVWKVRIQAIYESLAYLQALEAVSLSVI
jgi:hypothetical protein